MRSERHYITPPASPHVGYFNTFVYSKLSSLSNASASRMFISIFSTEVVQYGYQIIEPTYIVLCRYEPLGVTLEAGHSEDP
jgi:hypothetical protein